MGLPFLSICPRIGRDGQKLVATTGVMGTLASLGTLLRRVVVDPQRRTITIRRRLLGVFVSERVIRFDEVSGIIYGYSDMNVASVLAFAHDAFDRFDVGLKLYVGREHVHLFTFLGDGSFGNSGPFPDWYYWQEYAFDLRGSQEEESKVFVDFLQKLLDRPIVPS